ncbi:MAG: guanylate kinase [Acidaminococcaceae bacterium]|nr:guanylate kinase [Acidaminococcaceae bacterium]
MKKGLLIVCSGPSGVGKGTVLAKVLKKNPNMQYSISITTRAPRSDEVEGINYFFKSKVEFLKMIDADEVLEYAEVFDNFYATPKAYVEEKLHEGKDVVLEIDVQGAMQIKEKMPEAVLIFLAPPSFEELERRLRGRASESIEVISRRLQDAHGELAQQDKYDYVIVNKTVDETVKEFMAIVEKEKEKRK